MAYYGRQDFATAFKPVFNILVVSRQYGNVKHLLGSTVFKRNKIFYLELSFFTQVHASIFYNAVNAPYDFVDIWLQ